ncbi:MAG: ATP-binding cassette domain-containing protein [Candidatus Paceibacterota bacterium]
MGNIIEVKNLVKKFKDVVAVDDISLDVQKGDVFALLGPNGAGKTTTIRMLTTLLRPTSGQIFVDGHDALQKQDDVRCDFGIVFQDPSVDESLTAYENLEFHGMIYGIARKVREERIKEMLNLVELYEKRNKLVKEFSGGMKRRLEIARGLVHHPKIFFLDEPTLGLDPQTRNKIWEYLQYLNKTEGTTIFFTTHYMEEVEKFAHHTAIVDKGKIIAKGTVEEVERQANAPRLEEAFLNLTGRNIREESFNGKFRGHGHH